MTQEEKQLLFKDLCARLPYNVIGEYSWKCGNPYERELTGNLMTELINSFNSTEDSDFKPYLRSMSSMTKEEKEELRQRFCYEWEESIMELYYPIEIRDVDCFIDWFLEHHFDYRGLIEKGLALEAPEDMYEI